MTTPKAAAADPEEIAGRYQVVKRLGAGAFGTVYKAKDKVLGRMLAIKTIRMEGLAAAGTSVEELVDRFKREAQISAQLRHPNIVTIYDVGEAEGVSYLAMEFIDGVGLDRVIAAAGRLPLERAALIAAQVADALDFAHRHSVVHRDIKPANIMVEAGDRVKVTDFGIAKVTDSGEHLTMTGSLLGTPSYMSPEQARGGKLDGRSDLFAVGAILYEMLAGQKAFRGDSITGLIFKIITEEPQLITELDPNVPPEIVQIIQRALAKAPEQRYQTGRELAEDLLAFTRTGATPTLRQGEIDTLRGASGTATPTVSGASPTIANAATQGRAPATEIAPPGAIPAAPRPVEPTYLVSAAAPPPPAVDPTYLVGSGRMPAPAPSAPPRPAPPAAAQVPPRMAAPPMQAAPPRTARTAQPQSSKTGLVVGIVAAVALVVLGVGGGAAWYFFKGRAADTTQTVADTGATGTGSATSTGTGEAGSATGGSATTAGDSGSSSGGADTGGGSAGATGSSDAGAGSAAAGGSAQAGGTTSGGGVTVEPASTGGAGTRSGSGAGTQAAGAGQITPTTPAGGGGRVATREPAADLSILDQSPPELTGRESGAAVADTYRNKQGWGTSSGSFGASGRLRARARVPRDLTASEKRAAVVLLNLRGLEEVHKRRAGSYGNFQQVMPVAVGSPDRFDRAGYRFELKLEDDGFTIMATSMSGRALLVDDTGYVRYVED